MNTILRLAEEFARKVLASEDDESPVLDSGDEPSPNRLRTSISTDDLLRILDDHKQWLPGRREGELFDLSNVNLSGQDLSGKDLRHADLSGGDLRRAKLCGAKLSGVVLRHAQVAEARFHQAILSDAKLADVRGLSADALAGADLARATLPDELAKLVRHDRFKTVQEHIAEARKFGAPAVACAACCLWLSVRTTDAELVLPDRLYKLPLSDQELPVRVILVVVPWMLFTLFVFFHRFLQRAWGQIARLPAVDHRESRLDHRLPLWVTGMVYRPFRRLRERNTRTSTLAATLVTSLLWLAAPAVLWMLWWRTLVAGNVVVTAVQSAAALAVSAWAFCTWRTAIDTLRIDDVEKAEPPRWRHHTRIGSVAGLALGFVAVGSSSFSSRWNNYRVHQEKAELGGLQFPPGFQLPLAVLPGATMTSTTTLREVNLIGANLVGSDLSRADLKNADLRVADLRDVVARATGFQNANLECVTASSARLHRAKLGCANLSRAILHGAVMNEAFLQAAILDGANLDDAELQKAELVNATLRNARLKGADLTGANLTGADLGGADLTEVIGLTQQQLSAVCGGAFVALVDGERFRVEPQPCPEEAVCTEKSGDRYEGILDDPKLDDPKRPSAMGWPQELQQRDNWKRCRRHRQQASYKAGRPSATIEFSGPAKASHGAGKNRQSGSGQ